MVYPIAGLLVGGGNYVSALLLSTDMSSGFAGALSAMLIGVIPIFFIPTVLKKSLSFGSKFGEKLSSFSKSTGARAGKMAGNRMQNSARFQNLQDKAKYKAAEKIANKKSVSSTARYRAAAVLEKMKSERAAAGAFLANEEFANKSTDAIEKEIKISRKSGNLERMGDLTNALAKRKGEKATSDFLSENVLKGLDLNEADDRKVLKQLQGVLKNNSNLSSIMRDVSPGAYDMISNAGITGTDADGNNIYGSYNDFVANTSIPSKDTDYAKFTKQAWNDFYEANPVQAAKAAQLVLNSENKDVKSAISSEGRKELLESYANPGSTNPVNIGGPGGVDEPTQ